MKSKNTKTEENKNAPEPHASVKVKLLRRFIYLSYFASLFMLLSVLLAVAVNRKAQPFYSWIEGTRMERYGSAIAGIIIEKKISMQVDARNDSLSEEDEQEFAKHIRLYKTVAEADLQPRDKRLILEYPQLLPAIEGNYLILTPDGCTEPQHFADILAKLEKNMVDHLKGCHFSVEINSRPHICFFNNRKEYLEATEGESKTFHDSLGYFSPVKNCLFFFSRTASVEGLELEERFNRHREQGEKLYKGEGLKNYMMQIDLKQVDHFERLEEETFSTLRHEAAHQLTHIYGIHSNKGFENKWLTEGIAQYFETEAPGNIRRQKKQILLNSFAGNSLIGWKTLTEANDETFHGSKSKIRQLAYSQSWFLVRYLMVNQRQSLIDFINWKKNPGMLESPLSDFEKLCELLNKEPKIFSFELTKALSEL